MATVNIAITATLAQLSAFADELGYQEFVPNVVEGNIDGVIANPQDRRTFLQEYFENATINELAKVRIRAIERAELDKREAEKTAVRDSIKSAVSVTFKA